MEINKTLKKLRNDKGLNQSQMAEALGISLSSYQKYEREKNSVTPSLEVLIKIADFHHVGLDYLVGRFPDDTEFDKLNSKNDIPQKTIDIYCSLTPKKQKFFLGVLKQFLELSDDTEE